jgi:HlyD family secretion protein
MMKRRRWIVILLIFLISVNIGLLWQGGSPISAAGEPGSVADNLAEPLVADSSALPATTVAIRSPADLLDKLTAAGTVELVSKRQVILEVDGMISQVAVQVGDQVAAGDLIAVLDASELRRAAARIELDLETATAELAKLQQGSDPGEVTVAKANLRAAQENLSKVQAGATPDELAAARSKLSAAYAKYTEMAAPPSSAEIDEAKAEMEKADITRQEAQRAYDQIKWRNDKGMTPEAAALHKATVEYERALAKFNRANQPNAASAIQEANTDIQRAENELALLQQKPTPTDLAEAHAKVTEAEQKLAKLQAGPTAAETQAAEAKVKKLQLDLEEARAKLERASILAPISGTVLEVNIAAGERGTLGKVVATLANLGELKLTIKVAEVDITQVAVGQQATIAMDAIRGRTFAGVIEHIDPINKSDKDVVNYPVTLRLTDADLSGVRPGMNALATLATATQSPNRWLVPTTALQEQAGQLVVQLARGEGFQPTPVWALESQGEWSVVESPDLRAGDRVLGSVVSYVEQPQGDSTPSE